ncbi:MAG: hypothetical protein ABI600_19860, partial [Luteolibacter sp.]
VTPFNAELRNRRPAALFNLWLQTNFTTEQIQAGTLTSLTANPSGDGVKNLIKYAMGFNPLTPLTATNQASLLQIAGSTGGVGSVIFEIPSTPSADVTIIVQASSSFATWSEIARRAGGGSWTGTADVFTGSPTLDGTRFPILVTEPATPVYGRRFYRLSFLSTP